MTLLLNLVVNALLVMGLAYILPNVNVEGFWVALVTAVVLALIGAFIRPILLLLTLPINILTLGLFTFVITALMVHLADFIVPGFSVEGFWPALFFGVLMSILGAIFNSATDK